MIVYVYFILRNGHVKVGVARDPEARLAQLQTGNSLPLSIIAKMPFQSRREAMEVERSIHRKYAHHRLNGEWFREKMLREMRGAAKASVQGQARPDKFKAGDATFPKSTKRRDQRIEKLIAERDYWREKFHTLQRETSGGYSSATRPACVNAGVDSLR